MISVKIKNYQSDRSDRTERSDYIKSSFLPRFIFALFLFCAFLSANFAEAATRTASVSGFWDQTATWGGFPIPTAADDVVINNNITVTVRTTFPNAVCASVVFVAGNSDSSIVLNAAACSLTVGAVSGTGNVRINEPTQNNRTKQINVGPGTFWAKSLTLTGRINRKITSLTISTGTATITGDITSLGTGSQIVFSSSGTLNVGGTFLSGIKGIFTASTSTVNFNRNGNQIISPFAYTFNNVTLSGSGTKRLGALTTANGNFTINSGTTLDSTSSNYALNVRGTFNIDGIFTANGSTVTIRGDWKNTGIFNAGASTVAFDGTGTSTILGSNTFHNFRCTTASKPIVFSAGSTQTVNGMFRIDGSAFATRVSLASSGGPGTTWNLVLNGTYDCRYVAVQGSTASGSVYFPILPAGFRDNGDNTNWYDPNFPAEMLFYDNFETSTLASAPPNKPSSYWTIAGAGGWLTQASSTVNTQNHTSNGSKSMYSSGGSAGQGIGAWNNPAWGPQTNCSAEAWFYDDMQNTKMQWLFIDNSAGSQGIGVLVETTQSTTKYRYCRYGFGGGTAYFTSFIDRTLGWHKVSWTHMNGTVELYLDDALLITATGLSDFSSYDVGSWSWHNTTGSTPMWFDDFMVYRSQAQTRYRWYDNDSAQTPTALAAENTAVTNRNIGAITRLRLQVQNGQFETWSGAYVTIQYREGSNGVWETLDPSGKWNYADGLGADKAQVTNALLTNTNVREHFVESLPSAPNLALTQGQYGEWDFAIVSNPTASLATIYYFRLVVTDSAGNYQRNLSAYVYYPQITLVSPTMTMWTGALNTAWDNAGNWTNGVPDPTKDAIIPSAGVSNEPSLNVSGVCKSLVVQANRTLTLETASTTLSVTQNISLNGTINQTNATSTLLMSSGTLLIDSTGRYNQSAGTLDASSGLIKIINGGQYNVPGEASITAGTLNISVGGLVNVTGAATFNIQDFTIDLNGQWISANAGNTINISGNFTNNGSMLGSTGGIFNMTNSSGTMNGTSTSTTFYQLNINENITNNITNDVRVLNNLSINATKSFTASTGNLYVGGNWTNSGTFNHGSGTVILNGSALQTITANSSNFNNLTVTNASVAGVSFTDGFTTATFTNTTANSLMTFAANHTYRITAAGGMNFAGAAGQLVKLRSSSLGSLWFIEPSGGGWTADYLDVQDSVNIVEQTIYPTNSTDSGNNTNWFTPNQDTNNDEIPDWWEYLYYGSLAGLTAGTDSDGDGIINLLEYTILSNPRNAASPTVVYVDDNGSYDGTGTVGNPYKFLDEALTAATSGQMVKLAEGIYTLSNYMLNKRILIKGVSPRKTQIKGPAATGASGDSGQMLDYTGTRLAISDLTIRLYKDEKPVISYNVAENGYLVFQNTIFKDNTTASKALLAPSGVLNGTRVLCHNNLFCDNNAAAMISAQGAPFKSVCNTLQSNTGTGISISGNGDTTVKNCIIRGNSTQINNTGSGTLTVSYSNVQGGYAGAGNIDSAPTYMDASIDLYRLLVGSAGENTGNASYIVWDQENIIRPQGANPDMGAYEIPSNDTDNDGWSNAAETAAGTNPNNPDSDNDGLYENEETSAGTNALNADTDGDLVQDGAEPPIGMNPAVSDGQIWIGIYNESFEDQARYPVVPQDIGGTGPWSGTILGGNTKYFGNILVEYVGPPPASYDGNKIITLKGQVFPLSGNISFIERNSLDEWWISTAFKWPRKRLPTDYNEACCIGGVFFRINENGNFCVYDPSIENWRVSGEVIADGSWANIYVGRDHASGTCDLWVASTPVFTDIPITGPDLNDFIRISFGSASNYDISVDLMVGYHESPF